MLVTNYSKNIKANVVTAKELNLLKLSIIASGKTFKIAFIYLAMKMAMQDIISFALSAHDAGELSSKRLFLWIIISATF